MYSDLTFLVAVSFNLLFFPGIDYSSHYGLSKLVFRLKASRFWLWWETRIRLLICVRVCLLRAYLAVLEVVHFILDLKIFGAFQFVAIIVFIGLKWFHLWAAGPSLGWLTSPFDMTKVVSLLYLSCCLIEQGILGLFDQDQESSLFLGVLLPLGNVWRPQPGQ